MKNTFFNRFDDFHAGRFLQRCLQESGFDEAWLAQHTESDVEAIEVLFTKPNMDAELFVSMGMPMGAAFWEPLHASIFHGEKVSEEEKVV